MTISVIGLGKLGLPIACILAKHYKVIGVDTNPNHLKLLRSGINLNRETNLDLWYKSYKNNITFTDKFTGLSRLIFIVVPTPSLRIIPLPLSLLKML